MGYHGTTTTIARRIMAGTPWIESRNTYDWLGRGIYFWEENEARAWAWADEQIARLAARTGKHPSPSVVGARIDLTRCFDLADLATTRRLAPIEGGFAAWLAEAGAPRPVNHPLFRRLDRAVLDFGLTALAAGGEVFDVVRGAFEEGPPAYPGAAIRLLSHVQLAVREPRAILSGFRVRAGRAAMPRKNPNRAPDPRRVTAILRDAAAELRANLNNPDYLRRLGVRSAFMLPDGTWLPPFRHGDESMTEEEVRAARETMIAAWERRTGARRPFPN